MNSEQELLARCRRMEAALVKIRRVQYVTPTDNGEVLIAMVVRIAKEALEPNKPTKPNKP